MASLPSSLSTALAASLSAQKQLLKPNKRLDDAVSNCEHNNLPPIAIGPSQGHFLSIFCQLVRAQSVLEIGTLGGYSTIWFAESVPGVHVTSIEFNSKHRDVALENVQDLDNVDILHGAALDVLPSLADEGKTFDFVFIDADWDEQREYFDWAVKLTRKGGCIYVDNVVRMLMEHESYGDNVVGQLSKREHGNPKAWALIEHVKADQRVDATMIPTLNTHKVKMDELVDGFVLAIVK